MPESIQKTREFPATSLRPETKAFLPQFSSTEYGKTAKLRCGQCSHFIFSEFYRVNGQKICSTCADQIHAGISTPSHGSLFGALLFGIVGAGAGCAIYGALNSDMGWTVGYLALFVGWIVGKTVMAGARSVGGFRVQVVAAALTYLAVALKALPAFLYGTYNNPDSLTSFASQWSALLTDLVLTGLASPFQGLASNTVNAGMGLIVLLFSMAIAWQLTRLRPLVVSGPFSLN
jgi:hypothetical protein